MSKFLASPDMQQEGHKQQELLSRNRTEIMAAALQQVEEFPDEEVSELTSDQHGKRRLRQAAGELEEILASAEVHRVAREAAAKGNG